MTASSIGGERDAYQLEEGRSKRHQDVFADPARQRRGSAHGRYIRIEGDAELVSLRMQRVELIVKAYCRSSTIRGGAIPVVNEF